MTPFDSATDLNRRRLLAYSAVATAALPSLATVSGAQSRPPSGAPDRTLVQYNPETSDFPYKVQRTPAQWRARLNNDPEAYRILRQSGTERRKSTELWKAAHDGDYLCRGCDLPVYEGRWFQPLNKGWVFFHHAHPNAVMFGQDGPVPEYGQNRKPKPGEIAMTEVHCRQCGSHLGHHLEVERMYLHCINGTSLTLA